MAQKRKLYRGDVERGLAFEGESPVDREAEVINGYAVMSKGLIASHGLEADDETLDRVVALGNKTKIGVKSRFGHPNMSSRALGTFLGRGRNFRRDGDVVRADLHLDPTSHGSPEGDLGAYTLDLAESDPEAFGSSLVLDGEVEYRIEKDGTPMKNDDGEELPPLLRPNKVFASDIVDEPAANSGFFDNHDWTGDVEMSDRATRFLDQLLEDQEAVERCVAFLQRYLAHTLKENPAMANEETKVDPIDLEAVKKEAREAAVQEERERIAGIRESTFAGQEELSQKLIDEGASVTDAMSQLIADQKGRDSKRLEALEADPAKKLISTPPAEPEKKESEEVEESPLRGNVFDEEFARENFRKLSAEQQKEYDDEDAYCGYWKSQAAGMKHRFHVA